MNDDSALSSVVLPEPVPPEMITLSRASTIACSTSTTLAGIEPYEIMVAILIGILENLRIDSSDPSMAKGATIALTREPSASRASTNGDDSSTRRPTAETIFWMIRSRCFSS